VRGFGICAPGRSLRQAGNSRLGTARLRRRDRRRPTEWVDYWPGAEARGGRECIDNPDEVAERMEEAIEAIGGDGFLISTPFQCISRRFINEVCRVWCRHCNDAALRARPIPEGPYARP